MLDIWPELPARSAADLAELPAYYRLPGPNQWPVSVPGLRDVVGEWRAVVSDAAHRLLRAWAASLGQDAGYFDRAFEHPTTRMKIVRYPPAPAPDTGNDPGATHDGLLGVGAHKDGGCVTLLWVQPGVGGLQVWTRAGRWADVAPAPDPGGFVCNIGEMVELATGGFLKATVHRVVPTQEERISVPMFFNPGLDARLPRITLPEPLRRELGDDALPASAHDDDIFETYGDNLLKSRLRAHPDVAQRWYPDLLAK